MSLPDHIAIATMGAVIAAAASYGFRQGEGDESAAPPVGRDVLINDQMRRSGPNPEQIWMLAQGASTEPPGVMASRPHVANQALHRRPRRCQDAMVRLFPKIEVFDVS